MPPYVKQSWANGIVGGTPVSAARLAYIESGIEAAMTAALEALAGIGSGGDGLTPGLDNTGIGDNAAVANAAIAAMPGVSDSFDPRGGGKIKFGSGIYRLEAPITGRSNIVIEGQGASTILLVDGDFPAIIFESPDSWGMQNWAVRNLVIMVNGVTTDDDGSCANGSPGITMPTYTFTAEDVGKDVLLVDPSAGYAIRARSRIASVSPPHSATLEGNCTGSSVGTLRATISWHDAGGVHALAFAPSVGGHVGATVENVMVLAEGGNVPIYGTPNEAFIFDFFIECSTYNLFVVGAREGMQLLSATNATTLHGTILRTCETGLQIPDNASPVFKGGAIEGCTVAGAVTSGTPEFHGFHFENDAGSGVPDLIHNSNGGTCSLFGGESVWIKVGDTTAYSKLNAFSHLNRFQIQAYTNAFVTVVGGDVAQVDDTTGGIYQFFNAGGGLTATVKSTSLPLITGNPNTLGPFVNTVSGVEPDGLAFLEPANNRLWVKSEGIYKYVTLAVLPVSISDNFNRANNPSSLGVTSTGASAWVDKLGTWGIISNTAYCSTHAGSDVTVVNCGAADCTVSVDLPVAGNGGLIFRYVDASNYFVVSNGGQSIDKFTAGVLSNVLGYYAVGSNGDNIEVVLAGSSITLNRNGVLLGNFTDTDHLTATQHGLANNSSTTARFDNFEITL